MGGREVKLADTIKAARTVLRRLQHEREMTRHGLEDVVAQGRPLTQIAAEYVAELAARGTVRPYQRLAERAWASLLRLNPRVVDASTLTTEVVLRWRRELLESGRAPRTVNHYVSSITTSLKWAEGSGLITRSLVRPIRRLSIEGAARRLVRRALEPGEVVRMLSAAREVDRRMDRRGVPRSVWLLVALDTGARLSEILTLRWEDFRDEPAGASIVIRPPREKSRRGRTCPISDEVAAEVRAMRARGAAVLGRIPAADDPIIPTRTGKCVHVQSLRRWLRRVMAEAGVEERTADGVIGPHAMRMTFATEAVAAGVDWELAAEMLGHADTTMLRKIYADLRRAPRSEALRRIREARGASGASMVDGGA